MDPHVINFYGFLGIYCGRISLHAGLEPATSKLTASRF